MCLAPFPAAWWTRPSIRSSFDMFMFQNVSDGSRVKTWIDHIDLESNIFVDEPRWIHCLPSLLFWASPGPVTSQPPNLPTPGRWLPHRGRCRPQECHPRRRAGGRAAGEHGRRRRRNGDVFAHGASGGVWQRWSTTGGGWDAESWRMVNLVKYCGEYCGEYLGMMSIQLSWNRVPAFWMVFDRKKWAGICRCTAGSPLLGWPIYSVPAMFRTLAGQSWLNPSTLLLHLSICYISMCEIARQNFGNFRFEIWESQPFSSPKSLKKNLLRSYGFGLFRILLSNLLGELFPRKPGYPGSEIRDLDDPVLITLRPSTTSGPLETWTCVFWNETEQQWSTEGAGPPGQPARDFP